jgi:hypothetical protein
VLTLFIGDFAEPGEPMRFVITRAQLEAAFDSFR